MEVGCVIFGMKHKKIPKKRERLRSLRLERQEGLEGFQTATHPGRYLAAIS
jgi:hypothetical protein